jgi:uncharacterized protein (TIGR04255 family)
VIRPSRLPSFTNPPLDEVVLGVQFTPSQSYTSINVRDIWELFKNQFPMVQEHPAIPPQYETFGGATVQPSFQLQFGPAQFGNRLWFISEDQNRLLQFQSDRFLMNWRKNSSPQPYPRFEALRDSYAEHLSLLENYMISNFQQPLIINQAEISYINIIPVSLFADIAQWSSLISKVDCDIEGLTFNFSEILYDASNNPFGRIFYFLQSIYSTDGTSKAINFTLTVRGKPKSTGVASAFSFFELGREKIVSRFKQLTTDLAHKSWGIEL